MTTKRTTSAYLREEIMTLSPLRLVVRVMQGATTAITRARELNDAGKHAQCRHEMNRARALVTELRAALDHGQGGEIAQQLEGIYEFVTTCLLRPGDKADARDLVHAENLIRTIKGGFDAIIASESTAAV